MWWRGLGGAVLGAAIGALIAATLTALLFGLQLLIFDVHDLPDRWNDFERLSKVLPMLTLAGIVIGAIGGLAARLPRKGLNMLTSLSVVAGCAVLAQFPVQMLPRYKGSPEPSWIPALIAAFAGGLLVLFCGVVITKRCGTNDSSSRKSGVSGSQGLRDNSGHRTD